MFHETQSGGPTLWVDVSTLLIWRGKFTGIPRTLASLLSIWLEDGQLRLRLCRYSEERRAFEEVARSIGAEPLTSQGNATPGEPRETSSLAHRFAIRRLLQSVPVRRMAHRLLKNFPSPQSARVLLKDLYQHLPWHLQEAGRAVRLMRHHLWSFMVEGGRSAGRAIRGIASRKQTAPPPDCPFAPGDLLLIAGGGWNDEHFCETLWRLKRTRGIRLSSIIYDLIAIKNPHFFYPFNMPALFEAWAHKLICLSDLILTISESSRRDILEAAREKFGRQPDVVVFRLGDELPNQNNASRPAGLPTRWVKRPFVLSAGTVEVRKNHTLLAQVWRRLIEQRGAGVPPLIFAGQTGWLTNELLLRINHDPLLQRHVLHLTNATDQELNWLYQHCLFTLYPSHYEGWGLPVAESLAHGKYCICSSASSLPEIAGDLIDYHDPIDAIGCLRLVERAVFEKGFLEARMERIRKEFRPTSWRACADTVLRLLAGRAEKWGRQPAQTPHSDDAPIRHSRVA